jgi:hypothetical protein
LTDPLITLRNLIINNWSLTDSDLDTIGASTKDIVCTTGWYDSALPQKPQICIVQAAENPIETYLGYTHVYAQALYDIHVWIPISRVSNAGAGLAKKWLYAVRREVQRIILAHKNGNSGIDELFWYDGRVVPEPDVDPPVLHYVVTVQLRWYEATST